MFRCTSHSELYHVISRYCISQLDLRKMFKFDTNRKGRSFSLAYLDIIVLSYYNISMYSCDKLRLKLTRLSYELVSLRKILPLTSSTRRKISQTSTVTYSLISSAIVL